MTRKQNIRWKSGFRIGLIIVLTEVLILFGLDMAIFLKTAPNIYWYFTYTACFLVGFIDNYYLYQFQSALRMIFVNINRKLQHEDGSVVNISRHARDHFDAVLIAQRTNDMFGWVLASWLTINFFTLTSELNFSWLRIKAAVASREFNLNTVVAIIWIVTILANLVFLIGAWNATAEEVRLSSSNYLFHVDLNCFVLTLF